MKVLIESIQVNARSGISKRTNQPYNIRSQDARVMSDYLRGVIQLTLGDEQQPYPVGEYDCDLEKCAVISRFGRLELGTVRLTPIQEDGKKASTFPFSKTA